MEAAIQVQHAPPAPGGKPHLPKAPVKPKNGRYVVVLIAGGPKDRARELKELLAKKKGVFVKYHIEYDHGHGVGSGRWGKPIPKDVDVVVCLKSMIGHAESGMVKAAAKKAGVLCVTCGHKWTNIYGALWWQGVGTQPSLPLTISGEPLVEIEGEASDAKVAEMLPAAARRLGIVDVRPPDVKIETKPEAPAVVVPVTVAPAAPVPAYATPGTASAETIGLILDLQRRVRLEGLGPILVSATEITVSAKGN